MERVKVVINNEEESKLAQNLFGELGLIMNRWSAFETPKFVCNYSIGEFSDYKFEDTGLIKIKVVSLEQLRDMVVLKRNDVGDATHIDSNNYDWYVSSDEKRYRHQGDVWVYQPYVYDWDIKPISKTKEYPQGTELVVKRKDGSIRYFKDMCGYEFYENKWRGISIPFATIQESEIIFLREGCQAYWDNDLTRTLPSRFNYIYKKPKELPFVDDKPPHTPMVNGRCRTIPIVDDEVDHPQHYTSHPSGIECIDITRHHDFAIGNAIKYLWRAGLKDSDNEIQDLEKAVWYIQDKISQLKLVH